MASGILGQAALSQATETIVYTVPSSTLAVVNINVVNRSPSAAASVRVALASTTIPTSGEYIEYDTLIPPLGVLERTGIAINASRRVIIRSSTNDCSANVYGLEQSA